MFNNIITVAPTVSQLEMAVFMGRCDFQCGKSGIPAQSKVILDYIYGTLEGKVTTIPLMKAFVKGWDLENLAQDI